MMHPFFAIILTQFFPEPLPVLRPLPPHVQAVQLDAGLLALHIQGADRINSAAMVGFVKPSKEDAPK